jgi:hypothetical protein
VAETRGKFGKPEEGECPLLEAGDKRTGEEMAYREDSVHTVLSSRVGELSIALQRILITSVQQIWLLIRTPRLQLQATIRVTTGTCLANLFSHVDVGQNVSSSGVIPSFSLFVLSNSNRIYLMKRETEI